MKEKVNMELTNGSKYKIFSLGGKENILESEGYFEGYINVGVDVWDMKPIHINELARFIRSLYVWIPSEVS